MVGTSCQPCGVPASTTTVQLATMTHWLGPVSLAMASAGVRHDDSAAVGVSVAPGRVVQARVDQWASESRPHLLIAVRRHAVEVGPWVLPGSGPCARCVEAATLDVGDADAPPDLDPALLTVAMGWAARELRDWRQSRRPATWSTSWQLDGEPVPQRRDWRMHPYCGCTWFESA